MRVIISKFRHRSSDTQCHEVILCTEYVHSGKLKVKKIWLYGARFGSLYDVQTSSLVLVCSFCTERRGEGGREGLGTVQCSPQAQG